MLHAGKWVPFQNIVIAVIIVLIVVIMILLKNSCLKPKTVLLF